MPATRQPLSVAIITLNAASQLEDCLKSACFADDIVVVDSGSTDGTQALAMRYGARLIDQTWLGFGPQKQFAVDAARHDWVLCLDADERVSPELRKAIEQTLQEPADGAYRFARCNRFLGRYLKHGEGYPDWSLRLFDRLMTHHGRDGQLLYARAEALRSRARDEDFEQALAALDEADALPDRPAEAMRLRGQILRHRNDAEGARNAFRNYLELRPGAPDAPMIRSYVETPAP